MQASRRAFLRMTIRAHVCARRVRGTAPSFVLPGRHIAAPRVSLAVLMSGVFLASTGAVTHARSRESAVAVKAEELYNSPSYSRRELMQFLERAVDANPRDVGLLWRLARAKYDVATLPSTTPVEKKTLIYRARDVIQSALELDANDFAVHKWFGIVLSSIGEFEGSKVTIANSFIVRDHWLKAIELNPSDATSFNLLGRWCLTIADISWIERQLAAAIFGTPPRATYADALAYFLQADAISPGFWKKNSLQIAQTYLKMKDTAQAKDWLVRTLAVPVSTPEDKQVHDEAQTLLSTLK
ncbi:hypothetical protein H310_02426 [Aphanomyces invadans]|uniref:Regulator of microtubule dynamics protein 1 n=1 Tax=Aphanomyces invadans TaxID=157072 RepID=A0A024UP28_9STRA|nr:hypothetical protein H310_02426 [Aphanomyces invadans]ETW08059.1 hypothetical protein H310_02426 [Aphanomyces invadans]|eukprot:XP_008864152.1 hypothetical protein H310_02426 [Aphanomyces invadans]